MELTVDRVEERNDQWLAILRRGARDLTREEYASMLPPPGPKGSHRNQVRGARIRMLNRRGFTVRGRICK